MCRLLALLVLLVPLVKVAPAQPLLPGREQPRHDVLSDDQWVRVRGASDKALRWLARQQQPDGSFRSNRMGQPGVTSLAVLAFMANGHLPGEGPYGATLERAVQFVLSCQKPSGLLAVMGPEGATIRPRPRMQHEVGVAATYNHAISGLMLSEVYGMGGDPRREGELADAIRKAVDLTLQMQRWPKPRRVDYGGWRYLHAFTNVEADLSVVGWHLKLLRSAKNSGFNVPQQAIDDAVVYVLNCFNPGYQTFEYDTSNDDRRTRAMAGVGILALAHSSQHDRREALAAADFILREGFANYNQFHRYTYHRHYSDRYHYGVFMCTMAMYQIGGRHWSQYYPPTVRVLLANQQPSGAWPPEGNHDAHFGQCYTTSLVVLALSAPNQLLPVYQR